MATSITPQIIADWLDRNGRSRDWLAQETGASPTTVSGWLAKGKPRPIPIPTLKLIERLICDDMLGENQYSMDEALLIRQAMDNEGYANLREFQRDAVLSMARNVAKPPQASVLDLLHSELEPANIYELPFLGFAAAGQPVSAPLNETLPVSHDYAPGHFVVEIDGRSGEPDFQDGERWVIDGRDCFTPKKGKPCIVSDGYGSYLKKWNKSRGVFESINPAFPEVLPLEGAKLQGYPVERL